MADSRMMKTAFWDDEYIETLDPLEKLMFLYFLTNGRTHICGVYQIPRKYMLLDTRIDPLELDRIIEKFDRDGKMRYQGGWMALRNWIKNQQNGPMVRAGIIKGLERGVPSWVFDFIQIPYGYPSIRVSPEDHKEVPTAVKEEDAEIPEELSIGESPVEEPHDPPSPPPEKVPRGENMEITEMIADLKKSLSLTDFKEPQAKQRIAGMNLVNLRRKLSRGEFDRRLKELISDAKRFKKCNSMDFIFSELKAQEDITAKKGAKVKNQQESVNREKQNEERLKQELLAETTKWKEKYKSLPEEERAVISKEAIERVKGMGLTEEGEKAKSEARYKSYLSILHGSILKITRARYENTV